MIVNGFIEPITKTLPMEYAVELSPAHRAEHGGRGRLAPAPPMTTFEHFTPDAARSRRPRLAGRRAAPTAAERLGRRRVADRRRGDLALQPHRRARPVDRSARCRPNELGRAGRRARARRRSRRRRGGRAVRAGRRAQRPGRAPRARRRPRGQGRAWCAASPRARPTSSRRWLGRCSDASPDAFTALHDAFLAGGAFVQVPAGVVVEQPIVVLHWSEGDGLASFPHTLVVAEDGAEVTVARPLRLDRHDVGASATSSTRSSS